MTNSWDWVEKQNQRERRRKGFLVFGLIVTLSYFLFTVGTPLIYLCIAVVE